jgi:quercetin dioxygenase-like cupin family protein
MLVVAPDAGMMPAVEKDGSMKKTMVVCVIAGLVAGLAVGLSIRAGEAPQVKAEELLRSDVDIECGDRPCLEVMVSVVEIPAGAVLARHYHHGEEYLYALSGSAKVWYKDRPEVAVKQGDVHKIPAGLAHTAIPGDDGVKALVFRVVEKGKPVRVNVDEE